MLGRWNYDVNGCDFQGKWPNVAAAIAQGNALIGTRDLFNPTSTTNGIPDDSQYGWCRCSTSACPNAAYPTPCNSAVDAACFPPAAGTSGNCPDLASVSAITAVLSEFNNPPNECG